MKNTSRFAFLICFFCLCLAFLFGASPLDLDAYKLRNTGWVGRLDNTEGFLPTALKLTDLPANLSFDQFQKEIFIRKSSSSTAPGQALSVLHANPLTPDFILKNRLAVVEIVLVSGFQDPVYGTHCGGSNFELLDN